MGEGTKMGKGLTIMMLSLAVLLRNSSENSNIYRSLIRMILEAAPQASGWASALINVPAEDLNLINQYA